MIARQLEQGFAFAEIQFQSCSFFIVCFLELNHDSKNAHFKIFLMNYLISEIDDIKDTRQLAPLQQNS